MLGVSNRMGCYRDPGVTGDPGAQGIVQGPRGLSRGLFRGSNMASGDPGDCPAGLEGPGSGHRPIGQSGNCNNLCSRNCWYLPPPPSSSPNSPSTKMTLPFTSSMSMYLWLHQNWYLKSSLNCTQAWIPDCKKKQKHEVKVITLYFEILTDIFMMSSALKWEQFGDKMLWIRNHTWCESGHFGSTGIVFHFRLISNWCSRCVPLWVVTAKCYTLDHSSVWLAGVKGCFIGGE